MLKKLYKYEFINLTKYLFLIVPFMFLSGIGSALINKYLTEDTFLFNTLKVSGTTLYIFSLVACVASSYIVVVFRYFKDLFMSQGYLSFTLPVKNTSHYFCKLVSGLVVIVISFVLAIVSLQVFCLIFDMNIMKIVFEQIKLFFESNIQGKSAIVIYGVSFIFGFIWTINMIFTSITIGQQFKNRILASILSYVILYMILQAINTTFIFIYTFASMSGNVDNLNLSMMSLSLFTLIESIVVNVAAVFLNCYLLKNKLNLE